MVFRHRGRYTFVPLRSSCAVKRIACIGLIDVVLMDAAPYLLYSKAVFLTELMNVCVSFIDLIIVTDFPTICIRVPRFCERVISKEAMHAE